MASPNLKYNIQPLQGCPTDECQPWVSPTATNIEAFQASAFGYYVSDCVTVTQPHWAWKWVTIGCKDIYEWQWPQLQFLGAATAYTSSEGVMLVAANPGDGMSFEMEVTPNAESQVHLEINSLELAKNASIQVLGEKDGNWEVLGEAPIKDAEGVVLSITPKTNKIKVVLWGPIKVWIGRICVMGLQWVEEDQLVTICDGDGDKYRFGYNGQEKVNEWSGIGNHNTAMFWEYDTRTGRRLNLDPVVKEHESSYNTFANSPIWLVDFNGDDTIYAVKDDKGKWGINKVQIAKGDDVFRITYHDYSTQVSFSDGNYGKRIDVLNIENTEDYTLNIMHVSGATGKGSTVFAVTPGGTPSTENGSKKRLPDDIYNIKPTYGHGVKWVQPLIASGEESGDVSLRGVKIHPAAASGKTKASKWTEACYVVSEDYELEDGKIIYDGKESKETSKNLNKHLGSTKDYDAVGKKSRPGSDFGNGIDYELIQKSTYQK